MPRTEQVSFIVGEDEIGRRFQDPLLAPYANQYRTSEEVPPDIITQYYHTLPTNIDSNSYLCGWMELELGMHDPSRLPDAEEKLRRAQQADPTNHNSYPDASLALAYMPLFAERARGITPGPEALKTVRANLRQLLIDPLIPREHKGAAATIMLGVDQAIVTGDNSFLLWPSSPREGHGIFKNPLNKRPNHDCYRLEEGSKRPVEVKLFHHRPHTAADIYVFPIVKQAVEVITGENLYPGLAELRDPKGIAGNNRVLSIVAQAIGATTPMAVRLVRGLQAKMQEELERHKERYPQPGTVDSFIRAPGLTRPIIIPEEVSIRSLVLTLETYRRDLIRPELLAAEQRLIGALVLFEQIAGETGLGQTTESLTAAHAHIRSVMTACADAYRKIGRYAQTIIGQQK